MFEHLACNGAYSEAIAAGFMRELAEALHFLHSKDIIHADLKPENLMLSSWDLDESKLKVPDPSLLYQRSPCSVFNFIEGTEGISLVVATIRRLFHLISSSSDVPK